MCRDREASREDGVGGQRDVWVGEQRNKRVAGQMGGWMWGGRDRQAVNRWTDEWMGDRHNEWGDGQMARWVGGGTDR